MQHQPFLILNNSTDLVKRLPLQLDISQGSEQLLRFNAEKQEDDWDN